ncbi:MAG: glycosyltransferase family 39 protein [Sedimentisphaerales bacterium]|nr:glycosyltransferase family 39 protein [Sedimentisphaerales bacterium]
MRIGPGLLLLLLVVITKIPTLGLPYHWDELGAYIRPAHYLAGQGLWRVLPGTYPDLPEYPPEPDRANPPETFYGHPAGLYFLLAAGYRLLGESILVSHLLAVGFAFLGVYYTYRLGSFLFRPLVGWIAAAGLFTSPLYFAQSGLLLGDLPIAAVGVCCVYLALTGRHFSACLAGVLLVYLKETGLAIVLSLLIYQYFTLERNPWRRRRLLLAAYGLPVIVLAGFLLWQKIACGSVFPNPYRDHNAAILLAPADMARQVLWVLRWTFKEQYRLAWTGLILLHVLLHRRRALRREYWLFGLIGLFFLTAFGVLFFMTRYVLPLLPYLYLMGAAALVVLARRAITAAAVCLLILTAQATRLHPCFAGYANFDDDLQYLDMIAIHRRACRFLEKQADTPRVVTLWPVHWMLQEPYLGYVHRPIPVVMPDQPYDYLVLVRHQHCNSPNCDAGPLLAEIASGNCHLVETIEQNGKSLQIFQPRHPPSD